MAKVKVVIHEDGISQFLRENKPVRDLLMHTAAQVAAEAESTAQSAQEGPGGTIYGYAEAGFSTQWEQRGGKRPRVNIVSHADPYMALAAYFHTLKRDGVDHLRAALYKFTSRG